MVITSFAEVVSIGLVLPFLGALMSPQKLFQSEYIQPLIAALKIDSPDRLLLLLTLSFYRRCINCWSNAFSTPLGSDSARECYRR